MIRETNLRQEISTSLPALRIDLRLRLCEPGNIDEVWDLYVPRPEGEPMKTQIENVSEVKKVIQFEIPWEDVNLHVKEAVRHIMRSAKIPGFRPGKAPEQVVRSRFAQHIKDEVLQHLIPESYQSVLKENHFDVVSEPAISDVMYSEGSPFLFKITIETRPQVEIRDYRGIELEAKPFEVKDEEIDAVLKVYQQRAAELIPLPDTAADKGQYVSAHVKADVVAGSKKKKVFDNTTTIEVGSEDNHPAFNEHLPGKKAGDKIEFDASYSQEHPEKSIAGKTVHYHLDIHSVNERRLPEIDDEFAKDQGEYQSLNELKDKIRKDIEKHKLSDQRGHYKDEIMKRLVDANAFAVPETLVRRETDNLMQEYAYTLQRSGANLQDASIDWNALYEKFSEQATRNVRGVVIIQSIADAEKIAATEEDVEQAIARMADQQRRPPEAVKAELAKDNRLERLYGNLRITKTLDFLLDHANIKNV